MGHHPFSAVRSCLFNIRGCAISRPVWRPFSSSITRGCFMPCWKETRFARLNEGRIHCKVKWLFRCWQWSDCVQDARPVFDSRESPGTVFRSVENGCVLLAYSCRMCKTNELWSRPLTLDVHVVMPEEPCVEKSFLPLSLGPCTPSWPGTLHGNFSSCEKGVPTVIDW
jgi:hypothetical protein